MNRDSKMLEEAYEQINEGALSKIAAGLVIGAILYGSDKSFNRAEDALKHNVPVYVNIKSGPLSILQKGKSWRVVLDKTQQEKITVDMQNNTVTVNTPNLNVVELRHLARNAIHAKDPSQAGTWYKGSTSISTKHGNTGLWNPANLLP